MLDNSRALGTVPRGEKGRLFFLDTAEHCHEAKQSLRFGHAPEKDRLVDETKWSDPAERLRGSFTFRDENRRWFLRFRNDGAHTGISLPLTCRCDAIDSSARGSRRLTGSRQFALLRLGVWDSKFLRQNKF